VLEAHFFNQHGVEGITMLTFKQTAEMRKGRFHFYEEAKLEWLKEGSARVSEQISTLLFPE
jgi:hypothetical protein